MKTYKFDLFAVFCVAGIIFSTDYSVYDAIVIVGGDGSYRDAIAAIYEKMHNQARIFHHYHFSIILFSFIPVVLNSMKEGSAGIKSLVLNFAGMIIY